MDLDPLKLYVAATKAAVLTPQEELDLFRRYERGEDVRDRLIEANLRLVFKMARRYAYVDVPLLDLIQEGNLGLMRAVDKFDWRLGFKFSTYASNWITAFMLTALIEDRAVKPPRAVGQKMVKLVRLGERLSSEAGRDVTPAEIAEEVGMGEEEVDMLLRLAKHALSLDEPRSEGDDHRPTENLVDRSSSTEECALESCAAGELHGWLERIEPRRAGVLRMRYGIGGSTGCSLVETARAMGLSRWRVQQLEREGLALLREVVESEKIAA